MTRRFSTIAAVVLTSALWAGAADAQTSYVRYSKDDGPIYWGVLDDSLISRLSDAPYLGGGHTQVAVVVEAVADLVGQW